MLEIFTAAAARPDPAAYAGPERRTEAAPMTRWLARMLDEMDHGMLLVTANGALRHANQPAHRELACGAGLMLSAGDVRASQREQQTLFMQALTGASRGRRSLVSLGSDRQALSVATVPLGDAQDSVALVLLVLGKRHGCEALTIDFFARTQGLTNAEARVLQALCEGHRPKEVARQFEVAVSTVRTQISSIRTKTQTASIRDLVRCVMVLPAITPAMKGTRHH